jgi:hypothetical protein
MSNRPWRTTEAGQRSGVDGSWLFATANRNCDAHLGHTTAAGGESAVKGKGGELRPSQRGAWKQKRGGTDKGRGLEEI